MSAARAADPPTLFDAARAGDRVALARLLSLIERGGDPSRAVAALSYAAPGDAYTVGITGAPGAGKSTLTDRLIENARRRGFDGPGPVGVLAVDPSSPFTGGAILGDRVRMQGHALDEGVFIRSMATRGHLGGLSVAVPDAVRLLSAMDLPVIFIETVGVGQQEVEVAAAADTTVVVVNPGWGDSVQANKAGLLEIADLFVINKADRPGTRETRRDLELMLELTEFTGWRPPIVETVATTGQGTEEAWDAVASHRGYLREGGRLDEIRRRRLVREFHRIVDTRLQERVDALMGEGYVDELTRSMADGELDPHQAAERLLSAVISERSGSTTDG
jgi:LAO/AO transport system kinase